MRLIYEMIELGINIFEIGLLFYYLLSFNYKSRSYLITLAVIAELGIIILNLVNAPNILKAIYLILSPIIVNLFSSYYIKKVQIIYCILCAVLIGSVQDLTLNTLRISCKIINIDLGTRILGSLVLVITTVLWLRAVDKIRHNFKGHSQNRHTQFFSFISFAACLNAGVYSVLVYTVRKSKITLYSHPKVIEGFLLFFGIALIAEIIYIMFLYYEKTHYSTLNNFNKGYLDVEHEQIKQARSQDKSARIFRHNVREHFNLINYYAERGEMDELLSYLYSLGENVSTLKCKHQTGRDSVDGLIAFENDRLEQYNIKLEVDGALTEFGALSDYELCTLFSNAFQNAIEACIKVPDPTNRRISIHFRSNPPYKILEISNTVKENLKLSDTPLVTTKPDKENHGLGLMQIKQITHSHNGEVIINCTDNVFTLTLELKI